MGEGDDLRIDATGTVHPVGKEASQALRSRAGEWRLLASPPDILVAMREGAAMRSLRLAGEVRTPGALCDVVAMIAQGSWSGELVVLEAQTRRTIFFERGNVIGTTTNVDAERLGEILWRFGAITRSQLDEAVRSAEKSGKRLGEAAVELEFVGSDELYRMTARQVEEVFYAAVHVAEATFFLFDGLDDCKLPQRHHLSAGQLLMEAARRMDELQFFREKIPSDAWIPVPSGGGKKPPPELGEVWVQCDGRRSVAEIGRRIGQLEFEVTRGVFQLVAAGLVTMAAPKPTGPVAIVEAFNAALVEIHRVCEAAGKGRELRSAMDQFATSTGVYVSLFPVTGPNEDGSIDADRVARNVATVAGAEQDVDAWITQQMFDYAGFALFHAGSLLARDEEVALNTRVMKMLEPFRHQPEVAPPPSLRGVSSSAPASSRRAPQESP
jgi:hypothetical protein